jgi:hypothetical protein
MKVTGTQTKEVKIEISDYQIEKIIRKSNLPIKEYANILESKYIREVFKEDGYSESNYPVYDYERKKWEIWVEAYHGSDWTNPVRDATENEIAVMNAIQEIRNVFLAEELIK